MSDNNLVKITGLFKHKSQRGNEYLQAKLGGVYLVVMKNEYKKEGSNDPDYNLFFRKPTKAGNGSFEDESSEF